MATKIVELNVKNEGDGYSELIIETADHARYASDDHSKGTIEERLTNLNYSKNSFSLWTSNGVISGGYCSLERFGNFVLATISVQFNSENVDGIASFITSGKSINIGSTTSNWAPNSLLDHGTIMLSCNISLAGVAQASTTATQYIPITVNMNYSGVLTMAPTTQGILNYGSIVSVLSNDRVETKWSCIFLFLRTKVKETFGVNCHDFLVVCVHIDYLSWLNTICLFLMIF